MIQRGKGENTRYMTISTRYIWECYGYWYGALFLLIICTKREGSGVWQRHGIRQSFFLHAGFTLHGLGSLLREMERWAWIMVAWVQSTGFCILVISIGSMNNPRKWICNKWRRTSATNPCDFDIRLHLLRLYFECNSNLENAMYQPKPSQFQSQHALLPRAVTTQLIFSVGHRKHLFSKCRFKYSMRIRKTKQ